MLSQSRIILFLMAMPWPVTYPKVDRPNFYNLQRYYFFFNYTIFFYDMIEKKSLFSYMLLLGEFQFMMCMSVTGYSESCVRLETWVGTKV